MSNLTRKLSAAQRRAATYRKGRRHGIPASVATLSPGVLARNAWERAHPDVVGNYGSPNALACGAYLSARSNGGNVSHAVRIARDVRLTEEIFTETGYRTWDVDVAALRSHVASWPFPLTLPDGVALTLAMIREDDSDPEDSDCYSDEDIAAWRNDEWEYVGIIVTATLADGRTGEGSLWGVDVGGYYPGTELSQAWDAVTDAIAEAVCDAEGKPVTLTIPGGDLAKVRTSLATLTSLSHYAPTMVRIPLEDLVRHLSPHLPA